MLHIRDERVEWERLKFGFRMKNQEKRNNEYCDCFYFENNWFVFVDINLYSKAEYSQCCFIWKGLWEGSQRFLSEKLLCLFLKCAWKCVGFCAPFYLEIALVDPFLQEKESWSGGLFISLKFRLFVPSRGRR